MTVGLKIKPDDDEEYFYEPEIPVNMDNEDEVGEVYDDDGSMESSKD
jgi:hypothetical protein